MHRHSNNRKWFFLVLTLLIIVTCTACHDRKDAYLIGQFFDDLAIKSGLMYEDSNSRDALVKWGVLKDEEYNLDNHLKYDLFSEVIIKMLDIDDNEYLKVLKNKNWVETGVNDTDEVSKEEAHKIIDKTIDIINNQNFENDYTYEFNDAFKIIDISLKDGSGSLDELNDFKYVYSRKDEKLYKVEYEGERYSFKECELENAFSKLYLSSSDCVDINEAIIEPYGELIDDSLFKDGYRLLSNKSNVFYVEGFRISYTLSAGDIRFHISKKTKQNINVYGDFSLYNIKPSFIWEYDNGNIKHAFFKVDFNSMENFGLSVGKYKDFNIDIKELDDSSLLNKISSVLKTKQDEVDSTIPLCRIKLPIKEIPFVYLNMDLSLHIYASGKAEIKVSNVHTIGFEVKNNNVRFIFDHDHDIDAIINASFNTTLGTDFHLDAFNQKLMNIDTRAGIRAYVQSVVHLYDDNGGFNSYEVDETYDALNNALAKENDIKVCGDLSFHWLLNTTINSQDSFLGRLGLSKTFDILDDDNQVFNNLSHIENGHFVKKCTRKGRLISVATKPISSDKILLSRYSAVIKKGESFDIPIYSLPSGYEEKDLAYEIANREICTLDGKTINAIKAGVTVIKIKTNDNKFEASFNLLVSDG